MRAVLFEIGLLLIAIVASPAGATHYDMSSCAELGSIDDTTAVTSLAITTSPFECDSYTRFPVRGNLTIKFDPTSTAAGAVVVLSNFALHVSGTLSVEPDVVFQGVTKQETHGGALFVGKGASATFLGTSRFVQNSVAATDLPSIPSGRGGFYEQYIEHHGGAIHNKGELSFEGDAVFSENEAYSTSSYATGRGGAVYNSKTGIITFNANLNATENNAEGFFEGQGGAIYNDGEIVVKGKSSFTGNTAADAGAIYIDENGTMTFNDFANFTDNTAHHYQGGAIASFGSLNLSGGSLFQDNFASSSGEGGSGGGIYNGKQGLLSFGGDATFDNNWGHRGGAIYNDNNASISPTHDGGELIVKNLRIGNSICPGIYYEQQDGTWTCGP